MGQWLVADKNVVRHAETLSEFLNSDMSHRLVLSDFCCMESYKGAFERNLPRSLAALEPFAPQVLILKSSREITSLSLQGGFTREQMIDSGQTADFAMFCRGMRAALGGDVGLRGQLEDHAQVANDFLARQQAEASTLVGPILEIVAALPKETLARLRRHELPAPEDADVFIPGMLTLARDLFVGSPVDLPLPDVDILPQTFVLRFAVAGYLLVVDWIRHGGIESAPAARLANDVVDMNYVATASYFDGILTRDKKLQRIHDEAMVYFGAVFRAR